MNVLFAVMYTVHHAAMFFIGSGADEVTDDHEGFVAGRYRDGALSDIWTDVSRCAPGTFVSYLPACECGWYGSDLPSDPSGYRACQRAWLEEHFAAAVARQRRAQVGERFPSHLSDSDFDWGRGMDQLLAGRAWAAAGGGQLLD